jgi:CRISPR-associated protein Csx16
MASYFVTRHPGAIEWACRQGITATKLAHLDPSHIEAGDTVLGVLPVHLIAILNAKGARYLHLELDMAEEDRGRELSADDLDRLGARLNEYRAWRVDNKKETT